MAAMLCAALVTGGLLAVPGAAVAAVSPPRVLFAVARDQGIPGASLVSARLSTTHPALRVALLSSDSARRGGGFGSVQGCGLSGPRQVSAHGGAGVAEIWTARSATRVGPCSVRARR